MESFVKEVQIRWSDLDPNFHLRHSVYYDWGALSRIDFLESRGLTTAVMQRLHFGPIIFREECIFKKEIKRGDIVTISCDAIKARKDYSRWSIRHEIMKNGDTLCAILTLDGAWMNIIERKLAAPPLEVKNAFDDMPRSKDFIWLD
jgi:acyl-CoA thioester hydrolase